MTRYARAVTTQKQIVRLAVDLYTVDYYTQDATTTPKLLQLN